MGSTRRSAPAAKKAPTRRNKVNAGAAPSAAPDAAQGAAAGSSPAPRSIMEAAARGYPFYVYVLSDAAGDFYVGKGTGLRLFCHGRASDCNAAKLARIRSGGVDRRIVAFFADEPSAYAHESTLIREGGAALTNIARPEKVDPRESAIQAAKAMLAKVLPFDQWTPPAWLRFPFEGFATPRALYDAWVNAVTAEAESPTPSELHFDAAGRTVKRVWA